MRPLYKINFRWLWASSAVLILATGSLFSLTFEEFEKFSKDINNPLEQTRAYAVQTADRFNSEQIYILMKERLLRENSSLVINAILSKLEQRVSRKDFYYLLDFLKIAPNSQMAERSLKVMHRIHAARLQNELEEILKQEKWKIHLINYVNGAAPFEPKDQEWVLEQFIKSKLSRNILGYNDTILNKFLSLFSAFYDRKRFNLKDIYDASFLVLLESFRFATIAKDLYESFPFEEVCQIHPNNLNEVLSTIVKYQKLDALQLLKKPCPLVERWLLRQWKSGVEAVVVNILNGQEAFNVIIDSGSMESAYIAIHIADRLPEKMKDKITMQCNQIWQGRIEFKKNTEKTRRDLCFKILLLQNTELARNLYRAGTMELKTGLFRLYGRQMLAIDGFFDTAALRELLSHPSKQIRMHLLLFAPVKDIKQNFRLFEAFYKTESNRFIHSLFQARVVKEPELNQLFNAAEFVSHESEVKIEN